MSKLVLLDIGSANPRLEEGWGQLDNVEMVLFEPDTRSFDLIKSNPDFDEVRVFNYALDEVDGNRKLYLTRKPELTSFYKPNFEYVNKFPNSQRWEILEEDLVSTRCLKSIRSEVGEFDFVKIDTQGSELEILKGAYGGGLEKALGIEVEVEFVEIYKGQPLFGDVLEFLREQGFEFYDFVVEYRYGRFELNRKGQLAFADALFLRAPEWVLNHYHNNHIDLRKVNAYVDICNVYGLSLIHI